MAQERPAPPRSTPSRGFVRGPVLAFAALLLALPARALAAPGSETSVTVNNNPLVVYGVVAVLVGAVVIALFAARPRRAGLGPKPFSPQAHRAAGGLPWMPGGDILAGDLATGRMPIDELPTEGLPAERSPAGQWPAAGPPGLPPRPRPTEPSSPPSSPWSTGAPGAPPSRR